MTKAQAKSFMVNTHVLVSRRVLTLALQSSKISRLNNGVSKPDPDKDDDDVDGEDIIERYWVLSVSATSTDRFFKEQSKERCIASQTRTHANSFRVAKAGPQPCTCREEEGVRRKGARTSRMG